MTAGVGSIPWIAVASFAASGALFGLVAYLYRYRGKPGATWFMASLSMQGLWCLAYSIGLVVAIPSWRVALEVLSWIGLSWVGYLFLAFTLDYTGRSDVRQSWLFTGLAIVPAVTTALLLTTPYHTFIWADAEIVRLLGVVALDYQFQFWGYVIIVIGTAYAGIGVLLLTDAIFSYGPLYRSEALAVSLSTLPPTAGLLVWLLDITSVAAINWGVVLTLPHAIFDAYAFVGKNMFDTSPTTRRVADENAIDIFSDPVIVLDTADRIVDFNDAATAAFGELTDDAIGEPFTTVLGDDIDPANEESDRYIRRPSQGHGQGQPQRREFAVSSSELTDPRGDRVGHTVVFQEVTAEREREQRLSVLNRVLRHNLRNKLNAVTGFATRIEAETTDSEIASYAARITDSGEELTAIGEKAREFDQLRRAQPAFERVDLSETLEAVTAEFADRFPEATIETIVETSTELYTDPELLTLALENLIENALVHTDEPTPLLRLTVTEVPHEEYALSIAIRDNGPGIPLHEITVIEQGQEGELEHGSGIGLWVVQWCLDAIGGRMTFDRHDDGTTVRVSLPGYPDDFDESSVESTA